MKLWQKVMIRYLNSQLLESYLKNLDSKNMAHLYVKAAYLVASLEFISEEFWLQRKLDRKQDGVTSFQDLISPFFSKELTSLRFLQKDLLQLGKDHLRGVSLISQELEKSVLAQITSRNACEQKILFYL